MDASTVALYDAQPPNPDVNVSSQFLMIQLKHLVSFVRSALSTSAALLRISNLVCPPDNFAQASRQLVDEHRSLAVPLLTPYWHRFNLKVRLIEKTRLRPEDQDVEG